MSKVVYITEEQEQELVDKYLTEALIVNSDQVSDIVNYLNNFYQAAVDYAGDVGVDGLPCQTLAINYVVNGQPLQKLKKEELLDVINDKFRKFLNIKQRNKNSGISSDNIHKTNFQMSKNASESLPSISRGPTYRKNNFSFSSIPSGKINQSANQ